MEFRTAHCRAQIIPRLRISLAAAGMTTRRSTPRSRDDYVELMDRLVAQVRYGALTGSGAGGGADREVDGWIYRFRFL